MLTTWPTTSPPRAAACDAVWARLVASRAVLAVCPHRLGDLAHRRGGLLQTGRGLLGAHRQVLIAGRDLGTGRADVLGRLLDLAHHLVDAGQRLLQLQRGAQADTLPLGGEVDAVVGGEHLHQALQLSLLDRTLVHVVDQQQLEAGLHHHIAGVDHHPGEVGFGDAKNAHAGRLQAVEQHMVDGDHRRTGQDGGPVAVGHQKGQRDEDAEVQLQHAAGQLDVQVGAKGQAQQQQGGGKRQPQLPPMPAQRQGDQGLQGDGRQHQPVRVSPAAFLGAGTCGGGIHDRLLKAW